MREATTFDVSAAIEGKKLGRFTVLLVLTSWLVTFFDGYDMNVIAFASKPMQAAFHLDTLMLTNVLTIGVVGAVIGGFLFGYLGDRFGRRPSIIAATGCFSVLTLLLALTRTYPELLALRLLNGVALGGAIPLLWALNVEFVPSRFRATVVTLIMLGYGLGVASAGFIARLILPAFGWSGVFTFGGAMSFVATLILVLALPESLRFLVGRSNRAVAITRIMRRMGLAPPSGTEQFVISDEASKAGSPFRISMLFKGELRLLTPLLWAAYFASSMSTFFISSWGPRILEDMHFSADHAAWIASLNSLCGMAGGLTVMRFTDRYGPISVAVMPLCAAPLLLTAGLAPMSLAVFFALGTVIAIFLGGSHYAITSIVGLFYPSAIRANGAGWASSMAKIGSVLGPFVGGLVLSTGLPVKMTYALLAACPAAYGICLLAIGLVNHNSRRTSKASPGTGDPVVASAAE